MNDLRASGNFRFFLEKPFISLKKEPIIEINQALNGLEGNELMSLSLHMIETR